MEHVSMTGLDSAAVRQAMTRRLYRRSIVSGQISLPAVPAMIDEYVAMCDKIFAAVGRRFTPEQLDGARAALQSQLDEAFAASQRSSIVISYEAPIGTSLNYHVRPEWWSIEATYDNWVATREPPYFGTEPDARVWALAGGAAEPRSFRVLDIGAGTGRNALALARRGHPVDAVEMSPKFAESIRADAYRDLLDVRVIERDVFATLDDLRTDYQLILLSEVVSDFRTVEQLRGVFELAARCLAPGGRLVFNTFLAKFGYVPDDAARQLGQQTYTCIYTYNEMASAAAGLPLVQISDDSVHDYEKANLPADAWPPTGWYVEWVSGQDTFDVPREESPIELRWLVYEKTR